MLTYSLVSFVLLVIAVIYVTVYRGHIMDGFDVGLTVLLSLFWPLTAPLFIVAIFIDEISSWVAK